VNGYQLARKLGLGLALIALTISIHAMGVVTMALVLVRIGVRLRDRSFRLQRAILIVVGMVGVVGLLLVVLHGMEAAIWATGYLWLGGDRLAFGCDALFRRLDHYSGRLAAGAAKPLANDGRARSGRWHAAVRHQHSLSLCFPFRQLALCASI
jgi:hypothetical protein